MKQPWSTNLINYVCRVGNTWEITNINNKQQVRDQSTTIKWQMDKWMNGRKDKKTNGRTSNLATTSQDGQLQNNTVSLRRWHVIKINISFPLPRIVDCGDNNGTRPDYFTGWGAWNSALFVTDKSMNAGALAYSGITFDKNLTLKKSNVIFETLGYVSKMTSKNLSWRQKPCHDVKNVVMTSKNFVMKSRRESWRIVTSRHKFLKTRDVKK